MNVFAMSTTDRLGEILLRSERNFGPHVRAAIDLLRSPTNLAILAGTLVLWVGSHLFGVGEILDVVLLTVGSFSIGWSIGDVAKDLYTFADLTMMLATSATLIGLRALSLTPSYLQASPL